MRESRQRGSTDSGAFKDPCGEVACAGLGAEILWLRVGDGNGTVGQGLGKAREVQEAISKGIDDAKKNLIKVPVRKGTVPHEIVARQGGSKVLIKPASHGTGVIAGGAMRAVLESAGVTDVLAKSLGSSNPHNVVKATLSALTQLRDPITVAQNRNISLGKVFKG